MLHISRTLLAFVLAVAAILSDTDAVYNLRLNKRFGVRAIGSLALANVLFFGPSQYVANASPTATASTSVTAEAAKSAPTGNILTNRLLEKIRIVDQVEPDVITSMKTPSVFLLMPIVELDNDLHEAMSLFTTPKLDSVKQIRTLLARPEYDTKGLKTMFNRYADNIFYSDPERSNAYLAGGAVPDSMQTQKYLIRNEVMRTVGNLRDDVTMLLAAVNPPSDVAAWTSNQDYLDTIDDCREALAAMKQYLNLVDTIDLSTAKDILATRAKQIPAAVK